jgi:hypothetical protein
MKKTLGLLVAVLLLAGCGKKEGSKTCNIDTKNIPTLAMKYNEFSDKDSVNDEDLIFGYGIDVSLLDDYAIYISSKIDDPSMYMVLKPKSGEESVVEYQIKDMFEKYLSSYSGYYPEAVPQINNRLEKKYNGYLIYIISNNNEEVYNTILDCKD